MLSPTVQNKILMAAENVELQMIKDELGDGKYAILSDAARNGATKKLKQWYSVIYITSVYTKGQ